MEMLITSGGTKIPIDSVRSITNMSKGTFGAKIAQVALENQHRVTFLRAKNSASPFQINFDVYLHGYHGIDRALREVADKFKMAVEYESEYSETPYDTFDEYAAALERHIVKRKPDVVILAAAASDYGTTPVVGKVRSRGGDMNIELTPLPKLISKIKHWHPDTFLVGFKLLVNSTQEELIEASQKSIADNGCDLVVANDLSDIKSGNHKILFVSKNSGTYGFSSEEDPDTNYLARKVISRIEQDMKWEALP